MNSTLQLEDLPVEILLMICDYLDVWDLLSIRLTSRKLLEVTQLPKLNDKIVLSLRYALVNDAVIDLFRDSFLKYTGLSISGGKLFYYQEIFEKFGHDVKYLRLDDFVFGDDNDDVPEVHELFPHLKELVLVRCGRRSETEVNCIWPDLTSLKIEYWVLSNNFIPLLKQAHFPNLKAFHLREPFDFREGIVDIFADFLERHKATIVDLNVFERIKLETSSGIAKTFQEMNLKKLWLGRNPCLLKGMTKTSKLRYLNLEGIPDDPPGLLMDDLVTFISTNLRHLQHLDLSYCRCSLNDEHMIALSSLVDLRSLNISRCMRITNRGITEGIAKCKNERLLELSMQNMPEMDQDAFIHCTEMFPNLQVFDVSDNKEVNDRVVEAICRNLTQLKKLNLSQCLSVTLKEVELQRLWRLEEIGLRICLKITDVALIHGFKLSNLKKANLDENPQITYYGIKALVEGCPLLRELIMFRKCFKDTCDGGTILEKISKYWSFEEQRWLQYSEQRRYNLC